jgi:hypothetical protein
MEFVPNGIVILIFGIILFVILLLVIRYCCCKESNKTDPITDLESGHLSRETVPKPTLTDSTNKNTKFPLSVTCPVHDQVDGNISIISSQVSDQVSKPISIKKPEPIKNIDAANRNNQSSSNTVNPSITIPSAGSIRASKTPGFINSKAISIISSTSIDSKPTSTIDYKPTSVVNAKPISISSSIPIRFEPRRIEIVDNRQNVPTASLAGTNYQIEIY